MNVGGNAVILLSSDTAILGSQTNIGPGGSLTAFNGTQLGNPSSVDSTKVLTATGNATINANFVNNGVVNGPTGTGQELTFTQAVQGAGSTTGNVEYAASYKVGNSPDAVSVQNVLFDPTSTLVMEFAGDVPGSGYDQLDISGMATLNGTLDVEFLAGYTPSIGDSYDILSGKTTGSFVNLDLASLPPGMNWDTSATLQSGRDYGHAGTFFARSCSPPSRLDLPATACGGGQREPRGQRPSTSKPMPLRFWHSHRSCPRPARHGGQRERARRLAVAKTNSEQNREARSLRPSRRSAHRGLPLA